MGTAMVRRGGVRVVSRPMGRIRVRVLHRFWRQCDRGLYDGVFRLVWHMPDWREVPDETLLDTGRRLARVLSEGGSLWTCVDLGSLDRVLDWALRFRDSFRVYRLFLWDAGVIGASTRVWVWMVRGEPGVVSFYQTGRFYDPASFQGLLWTDGMDKGGYPIPLVVRIISLSGAGGGQVLDTSGDIRLSGVSVVMGCDVVSLLPSSDRSWLLRDLKLLEDPVRSCAIKFKMDPSDMEEPMILV